MTRRHGFVLIAGLSALAAVYLCMQWTRSLAEANPPKPPVPPHAPREAVDTAGETSESPDDSSIRRSKRHLTGELQKDQKLAPLRKLQKTVRDQEEKVKERHKLLQAMKDRENQRQVPDTKDELTRDAAIQRGLDDQAYVDAKRDFETDQKLLEWMKALLAEKLSQIENK